MIAIGVGSVPMFARVLRAETLAIRNRDYVLASFALGTSHLHIILSHVVPNILSSLIVLATTRVATAILSEAALSFLGLGIQPPTPSWGVMVADGRAFLERAPWIALVPGGAVMLIVLGFSLLGDGLRDALDVRAKHMPRLNLYLLSDCGRPRGAQLKETAMHIDGVTHLAIDVDSPGRMLRYLRDTFGLQALKEGYWHGDYVWLVGAPGVQPTNPAFLTLHRRQSIPRVQLNHLGLGVRDSSTEAAVAELQAKGVYVDVAGGDMVYGPEELHLQIDSFTHPRPIPTDPGIQLRDCPVDPDLPCLVSGINHVALDVGVPTRMIDWLSHLFDTDGRRQWMRKGWYISNAYYTDTVPDVTGRRPGLMPLFRRVGLPCVASTTWRWNSPTPTPRLARWKRAA